jgi:hypothetical protein
MAAVGEKQMAVDTRGWLDLIDAPQRRDVELVESKPASGEAETNTLTCSCRRFAGSE